MGSGPDQQPLPCRHEGVHEVADEGSADQRGPAGPCVAPECGHRPTTPAAGLREEAFAQFIEATANGRTFRGIAGPDRLVLYTLAANTGLRASELGSLTPSSFDLVTVPSSVTVEAGYSKHRRKDVNLSGATWPSC